MKRKNKDTPYLDFYEKCIRTGLIPYRKKDNNTGGLCGVFGDDVMEPFMPISENELDYNVSYGGYFGVDIGLDRQLGFGPTRQNIVLFLSCMNEEY
jgi:hypothetical protein